MVKGRPNSSARGLSLFATSHVALLFVAMILLHTATMSLANPSRSAISREPNIQVLTYVSACRDPRFTCAQPVDVPVPGKPGQCMPYEPTLADVRGSFTVTWSDTPSLPRSTYVAVCTAVEFWTLERCKGTRFVVEIPDLAKVLLSVKSAMANGGELLRLGYSGPWESEASFASISCLNVTTWLTDTVQDQALDDEEEFMPEESVAGNFPLTRAERVKASEARQQQLLARHRISFNTTLFLATAAVVLVLAIVGVLISYAFGDVLTELVVVEEGEEASEKADPDQPPSPLGHWLHPASDKWADGASSAKTQPGTCDLGAPLLYFRPIVEFLACRRPFSWIFSRHVCYRWRTSGPPVDVEVPLQARKSFADE